MGYGPSAEVPLAGKWAYPQSNMQAEQVICQYQGTLPAVLLRMAGIYTDMCDSMPLAHQMRRIYERRLTSRLYPGNTAHGQSFLHVDDLVEALWRIVERRAQLPRRAVMLLGEPVTYSYDQLQRELARLLHGIEDWTTRQIPKAMAKTGAWMQDRLPRIEAPFIKPWMIDMADDHYELDIRRARTLLDWQLRHRLLTTLPRIIDVMQADPAGWYKRHKLPLPSFLKARAAAGETAASRGGNVCRRIDARQRRCAAMQNEREFISY
jgi:nucleoside-diphosphate-sugar epimerase